MIDMTAWNNWKCKYKHTYTWAHLHKNSYQIIERYSYLVDIFEMSDLLAPSLTDPAVGDQSEYTD